MRLQIDTRKQRVRLDSFDLMTMAPSALLGQRLTQPRPAAFAPARAARVTTVVAALHPDASTRYRHSAVHIRSFP